MLQDLLAGAVEQDLLVVEHHDALDQPEQLRFVGDQDEGAIRPLLQFFAQGLQHAVLQWRVHRGGGLVQQPNAGLAQQGAGEVNQLALAARQSLAAFVDLAFKPFGVRRDGGVKQPCAAGRDEQGFVARVGQAEDEVFAQGARKQAAVLRDKADVLGQAVFGNEFEFHAVEQDAATLGLVHAREQSQQTGLAAADAANDGDAFSGADVEFGQAQCLRAVVLHVDVAEAVLAIQGGHQGLGAFGVIGGQFPETVKVIDGDLGLGPLHEQIGDHGDGVEDAAAQNGAGDESPHGEVVDADGQCT